MAVVPMLIGPPGPADAGNSAGPSLALRAAVIAEEAFELPGPSALVQGKEYQLAASHGLPDAGPLALALGVDYQYTRYEYESIQGRNRDLHRLQLPLRLGYAAGPWQVAGGLAPGVSTSSNVMKDLLDEVSGDDLLITARLEASHGKGDGVRWLVGLAWDRAFGAERLYPIAGAVLTPAATLTARLAFPESAVRWQLAQRQELLMRIAPAGHEWHVVSEELQADFDYAVEAWRGELIWSHRLWRALVLDIGAAYETGRHHEFVDDRGVVIDSDVDDALVFSVGIRLGEAEIPRSHAPMD